MANDQARLEGVTALGVVDKHLWHHTGHQIKEKGPKELTGMVELHRHLALRVLLACGGLIHNKLRWACKRSVATQVRTNLSPTDSG